MCKNTVRKQNSNSWSCLFTLSVCKESAPGYVKGTVEDKICKICRHLESHKHVLDSVNMFNLSVLYYALAYFACRAVCDLYSNKVLLGSCIYFIQIRVNKQTLPVPHFLYMYNHVHVWICKVTFYLSAPYLQVWSWLLFDSLPDWWPQGCDTHLPLL